MVKHNFFYFCTSLDMIKWWNLVSYLNHTCSSLSSPGGYTIIIFFQRRYLPRDQNCNPTSSRCCSSRFSENPSNSTDANQNPWHRHAIQMSRCSAERGWSRQESVSLYSLFSIISFNIPKIILLFLAKAPFSHLCKRKRTSYFVETNSVSTNQCYSPFFLYSIWV